VRSPWPATAPTLVFRAVIGFAIESSKASHNGTAAPLLRDEMVNMAVSGCQFDSPPAPPLGHVVRDAGGDRPGNARHGLTPRSAPQISMVSPEFRGSCYSTAFA
jgi:hypothetical protein